MVSKTKRMTRKELLKGDEIREAAFDAGHWIEENWRMVVGILGAVAVIAAAVISWTWLAGQKRQPRTALTANRSYLPGGMDLSTRTSAVCPVSETENDTSTQPSRGRSAIAVVGK